MKVCNYQLQNNNFIQETDISMDDANANLVLTFSSKNHLQKSSTFHSIKTKFPNAEIVLCSTAGEILQENVHDDSVVVTALHFEKTKVASSIVNIDDFSTTEGAAISLAKNLQKDNLQYILLISDGSKVNGSELINGLYKHVDRKVIITGGLAGDGANFVSTLVGLNDHAKEGQIVAIGFYGQDLVVNHGSQGGWDVFGLEKTVTKSNKNVLEEFEHQNALETYKKYLGDESKNLPGSALLFPLSVVVPGAERPVVRTILSIDEENKTMTFAGDIPVGSQIRFMKANFSKITNAASYAAAFATDKIELPTYSLLISCVGRKLILGNKVDEEVKAVSNTYKNKTVLSGFYSYGELSPFNEGGKCQLHNQTMTITSFYEK
jgi:hypothetical protein